MAIQPFTDSEWNTISTVWDEYNAGRKEIITSAGELERYIYFVFSGIQRVFYLDEHDREATLVFTYAPSFGGIIDSMALGIPSRFYFETLTPSSFLRANYSEFNNLGNQIPAIHEMMRKGTMQTLSGVMDRMVELQCYSAEERFKALLNRSPHILNLIPHKYIANYLGIDATNFSKLLHKVQF
jgi:CRP-like cAMP-binding protein